jgi:hypothetical protein
MRRLRNVTITLDDEVARWARAKAAEEDTPVLRLVGDVLRGMMQQHQRIEHARREFRQRGTSVISDGPYHRREDLHDRPGLR